MINHFAAGYLYDFVDEFCVLSFWGQYLYLSCVFILLIVDFSNLFITCIEQIR